MNNDAPPPYDAHDPPRNPTAPPPPYGFRNEYMPGTGDGMSGGMYKTYVLSHFLNKLEIIRKKSIQMFTTVINVAKCFM